MTEHVCLQPPDSPGLVPHIKIERKRGEQHLAGSRDRPTVERFLQWSGRLEEAIVSAGKVVELVEDASRGDGIVQVDLLEYRRLVLHQLLEGNHSNLAGFWAVIGAVGNRYEGVSWRCIRTTDARLTA